MMASQIFSFKLLVILFYVADAAAAQNCKLRFPPYRDGLCYVGTSCSGAVFRSLCPSNNKLVGCCILESYPTHPNISGNVTWKMFKSIFTGEDNRKNQHEAFERSLRSAEIKSCHQQSAFLTQIAYDTDFLSTLEEFPENIYSMSIKELKYLGRGVIQVRGKRFYKWLERKMRINVIDQPEQLAFPSKAFMAAALIWKHSYSPVYGGPLGNISYNKLADGSKYGILLLSHFLRGEVHSETLLRIWKRVNEVLKCPCVKSQGPQCQVNERRGHCKFINDCKGKQAESLQDCKGPSSAVKCSLDFASPMDMTTIIKDSSISNTNLLGIIQRIHSQVRKNPSSRMKVFVTGSNLMNSSRVSLLRITKRNNLAYRMGKTAHMKSRQNGKDMNNAEELFKRNLKLIISKKSFKANLDSSEVLDPRANLVLHLSYSRNSSIINVWDVRLKYGYSFYEPFTEERLTEKILTGPWNLNTSKTTKLVLEKDEIIYLAIPVQNETDSITLLAINNETGFVKVSGIDLASQLPANQDYYCPRNSTKQTAHSVQETHKLIIVMNSDDTLERENTIKVLLINSKAIIILKGMDQANIINVKVSQRHTTALLENIQSRVFLPMLLSNIWIILCCLLCIVCLCTIINAAKCYQLTKKTLCKARTASKAGEGLEATTNGARVETTPKRLDSNESAGVLDPPSSFIPYFQTSMDRNGGDELKVVQRRSLRILTYSQLSRVVCIFFFNVTLVVGSTIPISKNGCLINKYFSSFASNSFYTWILLESILGLEKVWDVINRFGNSKCSLVGQVILIHSLPTALAAIPSFSSNVTNDRCWLTFGENNTKIEIIIKSAMFLIAMMSSLLLVSRRPCRGEIGNNQTWRIVTVFTVSIQFSISWSLTLLLDHLPRITSLQYPVAVNNVLMGLFLLMSVNYQTKENIKNLQQKTEENKNENKIDGESLVSPAISCNILSHGSSF